MQEVSYPSRDQEGGQPAEWEAILAEVTCPPDSKMLLFTPKIMELVMNQYGERYARYLADSAGDSAERAEQLRRVKELARRKLSGRQRDCFLLYAIAGKEPLEIALELGIAPASARRNIDRAVERIAAALDFTPGVQFPAARDQALRSVVLPLDTADERAAFVSFINDHVIHHVAYTAQGDCREVLVVWSPLPDVANEQQASAQARTALLHALDAVASGHKPRRTLH